jgi:DNA-binding response OmpR family regulator
MGDAQKEVLRSYIDGMAPDSVEQELFPHLNSVSPSTKLQEVQPTSRSGHPNIMLIDDEVDILLTYKSFLGFEGYNVMTFSDAEQALERFSADSNYFDLVIADIRMPKLNGLQLFQKIRKLNPNVKVIFVSALDAAEEIASVLPIKPSSIVKKPVERREFANLVKMILSPPRIS